MRMLPSWALFALIVIGGGIVVVANTLYPLARAQEAKEKLAGDAKAIISPEIKGNVMLLEQFQKSFATGNIPYRSSMWRLGKQSQKVVYYWDSSRTKYRKSYGRTV